MPCQVRRCVEGDDSDEVVDGGFGFDPGRVSLLADAPRMTPVLVCSESDTLLAGPAVGSDDEKPNVVCESCPCLEGVAGRLVVAVPSDLARVGAPLALHHSALTPG